VLLNREIAVLDPDTGGEKVEALKLRVKPGDLATLIVYTS